MASNELRMKLVIDFAPAIRAFEEAAEALRGLSAAWTAPLDDPADGDNRGEDGSEATLT